MQSIWWTRSISESSCWNMAKMLIVHQSDVWLRSFPATIPQKSESGSCDSFPCVTVCSTMHAGSRDDEEVRKEEMHTTELLDGTFVTECDQTRCINSAGRNVVQADWECIQVNSEPVLDDFCSSFSFISACRHCLCKKRRRKIKKKLTQKRFLTLKIMDSDWENWQINLQENVCL